MDFGIIQMSKVVKVLNDHANQVDMIDVLEKLKRCTTQ